MKKYIINYNRTLPDHRITYDFHFYNELRKKPILDLIRLWKSSLYGQLTKLTPIYASLFATFGLWVYIFLKENANQNGLVQRKATPIFKYQVYSKDPSMGPYNNLLAKFKNQHLGNKDQSFDD